MYCSKFFFFYCYKFINYLEIYGWFKIKKLVDFGIVLVIKEFGWINGDINWLGDKVISDRFYLF